MKNKQWFIEFRRPDKGGMSHDYYRVFARGREHAIELGREYLQGDYGPHDAINARLVDVGLMPHERG